MPRKILIAAVVAVMVLFIYYILNTAPAETDDFSISDSGYINLLKGKEFSAIACFEGIIYAGGIQGLFRIEPETFRYEEVKNGESGFKTVRALLVDKGTLWVGHENGITIIGEEETQRIGKEDGLTDSKIIDLARADENTMFAATYSGVARISGNGISYMTVKEGLPGDTIKTILKDSLGWLWFGAYTAKNGGVVCMKDGRMQAFDIGSGLVHNCITSIAETPDHRILVGGGVFTEGGANIFEYKDEGWKIVGTIKKEDGLAGEKVRNIFIDRDGNTWVCSEYDGVAVFPQSGEITVITEKDGLSDNEVKKVVQDVDGNLWLATKSGITFIERVKMQ